MKRYISAFMCIMMVLMTAACSVPEPEEESVVAGPIEMPERFVGEWVCDTEKNLDPDTNEPVVELSIDAEGKLSYNGNEFYCEKVEEFSSKLKMYYYNRKRIRLLENDDGKTFVLMFKGTGHGTWKKGKLDISVPKQLVGTWSYVNPMSMDNYKKLYDENGEIIIGFTITEDGVLSVNGKDYPLNKVRTQASKDGGKYTYVFGEANENGYGAYEIRENDSYSDYIRYGWLGGKYNFWVHNKDYNDYSTGFLPGIRRVEINKDNFEDYFDVKFDIGLDGSFDTYSVVKLSSKVKAVQVQDLRFTAKVTDLRYKLVTVDMSTGNNKVDDMTEADLKKYKTKIYQGSFPFTVQGQFTETEEITEEISCDIIRLTNEFENPFPVISGISMDMTDMSGYLLIEE